MRQIVEAGAGFAHRSASAGWTGSTPRAPSRFGPSASGLTLAPAKEQTTICPYCGEELRPNGFESDRGPVEVEHAVAYGLGGGGLKVAAHRDCNRRLNDEVDEPLVQCWVVRKVRADYRIPNRHGKVPHPRSHPATDEDGVPTTITFMPFGRVAVHRRPTEVVHDDGSVPVRFDRREDKAHDGREDRCGLSESVRCAP